ncbi:MAG: META domain-containing protein [Campylobacterales bacterium]|jgi:heat shock protein HslJ
MRRRSLLILTLLGLLGGCYAERTARLADTRWELAQIAGGDVAVTGRAWLRISDQEGFHVEGSGGCNTFAGPLRVSGETVTIGPLISTRMACPDMQEEQAFFHALGQVDGYRLEGETLLLLRDDAWKLRLKAAPDNR